MIFPKNRTIIIATSLWLILLGCNQEENNKQQIISISQVQQKVDTLHPQLTWQRLSKGYDESIIDSVYQPLLEKLNYQFRNQLAIDHATYYRKLNKSNYKSQIFALFAQSNAYYFLGKYDQSIQCAREQIKIAEANHYEDESAQMYDNMSDFQHAVGNLEKSISYRLKALKIAEKRKDFDQYNSIKKGLGGNYQDEKKWDRAISCLKETLPYYLSKPDKIDQTASTYSFLAGLYVNKGEIDSAILYSRKSIELYTKIDNIYGKSESYNHLGMIYCELKKWDLAYQTFTLSLQLSVKPSTKAITLYNRASCLFNQQKWNEAITDLKNCIANLKGNENQLIGSKCYHLLYEIALKNNQLDAALDYHIKASDINDSLQKTKKKIYIHQLLIDYETEKKDKKIALLKIAKQSKYNQRIVLSSVLFLILFTVFFLLFRIRKKKQLFVNSTRLQESELNTLKNELNNHTKKMIYKTELIQTLENQLNQFALKSNSGNLPTDPLLKMKILTESDWNTFQQHFNNAYPHLIQKINLIHSNLSESELRMFLLVKLFISNKDIASMLGISIESVKKGRYRLKKKLLLDEGDYLDEYVQSFQ